MKKILLVMLFLGSIGFSQEKSDVVINIRGISKFHDLKELEGMTKGQLMPLYIERVRVLFSVIQYFGITNKPGVTFKDLGIPSSKENVSTLEKEGENRIKFLNGNSEFLTSILPYSDTGNIIKSILFYEEVLKIVHTMQE